MTNRLLLLFSLLWITSALASSEQDPNLASSSDSTEGRVLECQKCEAVQASHVDRHAAPAVYAPTRDARPSSSPYRDEKK